MFNNLIESTSHAREFKRRGSFLLYTTAGYLVLFAIAGVVSIHAYDARLEQPTLEIVTLLSPRELTPEPEPNPAPTTRPERPRNAGNNESAVTERAVAMLSVNHPEKVPEGVSVAPNKNPPLPDGETVFITGRNRDGGSPVGPGAPFGGGGQVVQPTRVVTFEDPPPPATPKPPPMISKGVINSQALSLPKPVYPELAKRMRIQGSVSVQVLIDESGQVISAKALSGSPFLTTEAQKAALQARFSPTRLSDQPVKVSGVITYNFVLGN